MQPPMISQQDVSSAAWYQQQITEWPDFAECLSDPNCLPEFTRSPRTHVQAFRAGRARLALGGQHDQ